MTVQVKSPYTFIRGAPLDNQPISRRWCREMERAVNTLWSGIQPPRDIDAPRDAEEETTVSIEAYESETVRIFDPNDEDVFVDEKRIIGAIIKRKVESAEGGTTVYEKWDFRGFYDDSLETPGLVTGGE